jgi:superfamily II DNA helicase RecQ
MLDGRPLACLLGSANKDRGIEDAALRGDYLIVYLTPEKLCSDGFLDRLAPLVERKGILLLAVDEAHCVSAVQSPFIACRYRSCVQHMLSPITDCLH